MTHFGGLRRHLWRLLTQPAAPLPIASSAPAALAATLLAEWETRTNPACTPAYLAARAPTLSLLAELSQSLLPGTPLNVDAEDVRTVLRQAAAFGLGTAVAHGEGRAGRAAAQAIATTRAQPLGPASAGRAVASLLCIASGPDCELAMDELTEITETIHGAFGQDMEMIFGHDLLPHLPDSALQVWLLVGFEFDFEIPVSIFP